MAPEPAFCLSKQSYSVAIIARPAKRLISDWKRPHEFDAIVSDHHAPWPMESAWSMVELIKISCRLADPAGFPAYLGFEVRPFSQLQNELPARERIAFDAHIDSLTREVTDKIKMLESV